MVWCLVVGYDEAPAPLTDLVIRGKQWSGRGDQVGSDRQTNTTKRNGGVWKGDQAGGYRGNVKKEYKRAAMKTVTKLDILCCRKKEYKRAAMKVFMKMERTDLVIRGTDLAI
ncbi:hypothetical protein L1987_32653 [Smallanthus sonchifolius]|uniref:Uncharacterized protein n=1 Tax=Smallanthus sonchifolius TaxID=185202 RepID=A0ACB9HRE8_9ASTR|nr:hypothetical protein L1987_32653 [Smallanthus sonchifolius]